MLRAGLLVTVPLVLVALALAIPLRHVLEIGSATAVALAMASLVVALAVPSRSERFSGISGSTRSGCSTCSRSRSASLWSRRPRWSGTGSAERLLRHSFPRS